MPEGPSIRILKEETQQFSGQEILSVSGNSAIDIQRLHGKTIKSFMTWGKHFLICFDDFTVKIHLLMFGTYRINERKETTPRLSLVFANGELNFYTCSVKILEGDINIHYNWYEDVMNKNWSPEKAKESLDKIPNQMICDAVLDQNIFSGVGNIIKNEVLYRCYIHPESRVGKIPDDKLKEIIDECSIYSFQFLEWKKKYELKSHWLAHTKRECKRCNLPLYKKQTGVKKRRSFFCTNCQNLYQ
ncbi:DNA-formamidopyrimidine glycosylase family protein [Flavobacterium sp. 1355]|uniref:DNA-formamidopyrimidine glycosylase family protein n=1 Tax=Flavobacterium sp. 1355 TaxID=2806571 RepID=UPI001AE40055|nr:DNA-formamidopyrimidine glycosylase family protein [Flavobacterium sp. 1355]MBP1221622.1 endonuclease-8 [Flavobacterium sp. 1355]